MESRNRWWQKVEVWILILFMIAILANWLWFEYQLLLLEQQLPEGAK